VFFSATTNRRASKPSIRLITAARIRSLFYTSSTRLNVWRPVVAGKNWARVPRTFTIVRLVVRCTEPSSTVFRGQARLGDPIGHFGIYLPRKTRSGERGGRRADRKTYGKRARPLHSTPDRSRRYVRARVTL